MIMLMMMMMCTLHNQYELEGRQGWVIIKNHCPYSVS